MGFRNGWRARLFLAGVWGPAKGWAKEKGYAASSAGAWARACRAA